MKYHCLQIKKNDCGFACLKMVLANFHHDENYLFLKQNQKSNDYSFLDLKKIAKDNSINLKGYRVDDLSLIKKFPCIGLIEFNNVHHYILIEKINKRFIYYFDPSSGDKKAEIKDFMMIFTGNILVVDSGEIQKCQNYLKKEKSNYPLIALLFNFLQLILLFLTSFIEDNAWKMLIIIVFFLVMMITNAVINTIIIKNYDKKNIYPLIELNQDKELINSEFNLKKDYFLYIQSLINQATILSFVCFILLVNDLKNAFLLLFIFLWELFSRKINRCINSHKLFKINLLEGKGTFSSVKEANNLAYGVSLSTNILILIRYVIIAFITYLICFINKNYLSFVYYFLLSLVVQDYFNKLLDLDQKKLFLNREMINHLQYKSILLDK